MLISSSEADIDHPMTGNRHYNLRWLRNWTNRIGATFISLASVLVALRLFFVPTLLFIYPTLDPTFYDWAIYGPYPTQSYASFNLSSPRASVQRWDDSCADGLILQDLHGNAAPALGPYITDSQGHLVWLSDEFGFAANLKVQDYHGQKYLTCWAGKKLTESGEGMYYMLDSSYRTVHTVSAVGEGLSGDLHEFVITEDGTALMTIYDRTNTLLPASHAQYPAEHIIDCVVQEVDIATGDLLFEWRASDQLAAGKYLQQSSGDHVDGNGLLDYFHINSIGKDRFGNYLISVRHTHSLLYVDSSGMILWALGGAANDFEDRSSPPATDFHWQHDARWQELEDDYGILTFFDNGIAKDHRENATYSQGRMIRLDFVNRTAELVHSYTSLDHTAAVSQGSLQVLPAANGGAEDHVFVGWGSNAAFSEFTIEGELLCETHFASSFSFGFEGEKSYRAIKTTAWHSIPYWDPTATIAEGNLYVSWNGATEVEYWALQGVPSEPDVSSSSGEANPQGHESTEDESSEDNGGSKFEDIDIIYPDGDFESVFDLSAVNDDQQFTAYRVAALDADGNVLRYSNVAVPPQLWTWASRFNFCALVVVLVIACFTVAAMRRWRKRSGGTSTCTNRRWRLNWTGIRSANLETELETIKRHLNSARYTTVDDRASSDCVDDTEGVP